MPHITLSSSAGNFDVTDLVTTIQWSGDYRQCARTLSVGLLADKTPNCPVGSAVTMEEQGMRLFTGYLFSRTRNTTSQIMDITAYDPGYYLNRNQITRKYSGVAPETAVAALCTEFEISFGALAKAGVTVSRAFFGVSLYQVMATLYTLSSEKTGVLYHIGYNGLGQLEVRVKDTTAPVVVIQSGGNLMDATVTEDGDSIVNRVEVYNDQERQVFVTEDSASVERYGVLQKVIKQTKEVDVATQASQLLNLEPGQKITLNCLGDIRCRAGGAVVVREPVTGLAGLYWIDSDTHQWRNSIYTNRLVVRRDNVMDEQTAGNKPSGKP